MTSTRWVFQCCILAVVFSSAASLQQSNVVTDLSVQRPAHCGLHPQRRPSHPDIPAIQNHPGLEIIQAQAFTRHGDRFYSGRGDGLCWAGQENAFFTCGFHEDSAPGVELSQNFVEPRYLFRKHFIQHRNRWPGTCEIGQLTGYGHRQMKAVGEIFRSAYSNVLISESHHPEEVYFRSTDYSRTTLSAQSFLQGLYNADCAEDITELVDIHTMEEDFENMVANTDVCPGLGFQYYMATIQPAFIQNYFASFGMMFRISMILNQPIHSIDLEHVADCFSVSLCQDWPVPEGFDDDLFNEISQNFNFIYKSLLQFPDREGGAKLSAGPLLKEMYDNMVALKNGDANAKKFHLFSGHDVGPIMLLLSAFDQLNDEWPPYASYISVELLRDPTANTYFVRVVYNGAVLQLPGCDADPDGLCSWAQFEAMMAPMLPTPQECPGLYRFG